MTSSDATPSPDDTVDSATGNSPYYTDDGRPWENQGNRPYGPVNLIQATQDSINTAYIDLTTSMDNGPKKVIEAAGFLRAIQGGESDNATVAEHTA